MKRPVLQVETYPLETINRMLTFCQRECDRQPGPVLLLGLAYGAALNAHQIRYMSLERRLPAILSYPKERSPVTAAHCERAPLDVSSPNWLETALRGYLEDAGTESAPFLFRSRSRSLPLPMSAAEVTRRVGEAGVLAVGRRLLLGKLNRTGILDASKGGHIFLAHAAGYAPSYATRLAFAERLPELQV